MIVKTLILTIVVMLLTFPVSSQDAMPTKEETVNYLNRKFQEANGLKWKSKNSKGTMDQVELGSFTFTMKGSQAVYGEITSDRVRRELFFNPAHIEKTEMITSEINLPGAVWVKFSKPLVKVTSSHLSTGKVYELDPEDSLFVYFLASSPKEGDRIVKALMHLRDLAKAEDELF